MPKSIQTRFVGIRVGILHQNFRLFLTLSLPHIVIKEASRYNLVFVPQNFIEWLRRYGCFNISKHHNFSARCVCTIPIGEWHVTC